MKEETTKSKHQSLNHSVENKPYNLVEGSKVWRSASLQRSQGPLWGTSQVQSWGLSSEHIFPQGASSCLWLFTGLSPSEDQLESAQDLRRVEGRTARRHTLWRVKLVPALKCPLFRIHDVWSQKHVRGSAKLLTRQWAFLDLLSCQVGMS